MRNPPYGAAASMRIDHTSEISNAKFRPLASSFIFSFFSPIEPTKTGAMTGYCRSAIEMADLLVVMSEVDRR
jgi:hypothetical protein